MKDGKIVLEKYFGTHTASSPWQWNSAGKTITSFMVGMAQQENYLSITDTTSEYLGTGWTSCTATQEEKITIWNQLTMTSGLDDDVPDHFCTIDTCLIYKADAGTRWAYHNGPYTLLDGVIANATGASLNSYTNTRLLNPTGMTGAFFPIGFNNIFFSNARSMARFGLLILNKGNWNGNQIMTDTTYFNQMINTSQTLNRSYGYLWWLNGKPSYMVPGSQLVFSGELISNAPNDMIAAIGKDGQFINVVPSQNLVWIRVGSNPSSSLVPYLMCDDIWEYLNLLECTVGLENNEETRFSIFPNPSSDHIQLQSTDYFDHLTIRIYDICGKLVDTKMNVTNNTIIETSNYEDGIYFVSVYRNHTLVSNLKLIKKS